MEGLAAWQLALGAACAFAIGVAKTGLPGVAIFVVPAMVLLVGDARQAAGWLLPILCIGDAFALGYWRRFADPRQLIRLAPWVIIGMVAGAAALSLSEVVIRRTVGVIILVMLAVYLHRRLRAHAVDIPVHGAPYGVAAGFATTVANAAGSIMNLYLLSMRLPKEQFLATAAWFFFIINLAKIPIYIWHGLFSQQSLTFNALMLVPTAAGALAGKWLVQHVDQRTFETVIVVLTTVATLALFR